MRKIGAVAFASLVFWAGSANAQQVNNAQASRDRYAEAGVGLAMPSSNKMKISGSIYGNSASASGTVEYGTGAAFSAIYGKRFLDLFVIEGEFEYTTAGLNTFQGNYQFGSNTGSGRYNLKGHIDSYSTISNLVIEPFARERFSPYIGGGLGAGLVVTSIDAVDNQTIDATIPIPSLATDLLVGFRYSISDQFYIGGRYQYLMMTSGGSGDVSGANISLGDTSMHIARVTGTFRF